MFRNSHYISPNNRAIRNKLDKTPVVARNLVSKAMSREERPRIGITTSPKRGAEYYIPYKRAVQAVGAEPVDLPPGTPQLPELDGLLLPGGWDVDPSLYGQEPDPKLGPVDRELDTTELRLFAQARDRGLPVMGICRGQQVINVAMGGSLRQHLDGHEVRQFGRSHLAHEIEVDPRSELGRAAGSQRLRVNSLHHQAVGKVAPGLTQTAYGEDGTVEALESDDGLIVAVQCHPEELTSDLPWARRLFEHFVERARSRTELA
jgi:putative glutamine amidotransferase